MNVALDEFKTLEKDLEEEGKKESNNNIEAGNEFNIREFFEESVRQEREKGHKPKRMGLVVKDLTVVGLGADALSIEDNLSPLKALWPLNWYIFIH